MEKEWIKRLYVFFLDLVLAVGLIGTFVYHRFKLQEYIGSISEHLPQLAQLEKEAAADNLSLASANALQSLDSLTAKATMMNEVLLPLVILLLVIITQMVVWKILRKTPIKRFIAYSIIPLVVMIYFLSMFSDFLTYVLAVIDFNIIWFVILFIITLVVSYYGLLWNVHWKDQFSKLVNRKRVIFPYVVFLASIVLYFIVGAITFIGFISESFHWTMVVGVLLSLVAINFARSYYIRKALEA